MGFSQAKLVDVNKDDVHVQVPVKNDFGDVVAYDMYPLSDYGKTYVEHKENERHAVSGNSQS